MQTKHTCRFTAKMKAAGHQRLEQVLRQHCQLYKAASAGKRFILVNPAYTSLTCSRCNHIHAASRKGEAFKCTACDHSADADVNAAINILRRGLATVCGQSGISSAGAAGYSSTGSLEPVCLNSTRQSTAGSLGM